MKKYILLIVLLFVPFKVEASCDNAEKVKLNKMASNVSFTYSYVEKNNTVTFDVTVTNMTKDLVLYDKNSDTEYKNTNKEITIKGYKPNVMARFFIYAKDDTCIASPISTYTINFPNYNPYYKDELCKEASDYMYCRKWINMPYNYDEFKQNIKKYISDSQYNEDDTVIIEEEAKGIFDVVGEIYVKYYYIILPAIIISCLIGIYHLNKKNRLF